MLALNWWAKDVPVIKSIQNLINREVNIWFNIKRDQINAAIGLTNGPKYSQLKQLKCEAGAGCGSV